MLQKCCRQFQTMGKYNEESVLTSGRAYSVIRTLAIEKESYATEIAEKIDMDRTMASEILSIFEESSIVRESKRKQAKYYELDPKGLTELFLDLWDISFDKVKEKKNLEDDTKGIDITEDMMPVKDVESAIRENMPKFIVFYVKNYSERFPDSSIKKMLTDDFYETLRDFSMIQDKTDLGNIMPDWLQSWFYLAVLDGLSNNVEMLDTYIRAIKEYKEKENH